MHSEAGQIPGLSYRHPRTGEWAHAVQDPLGEAREVFVRPALAARPPGADPLRILEVGFGRGLNAATALAELDAAGFRGPVEVLGFEPFPERLAPWPPCPEPLRPWAPWWGRGTGAWQVQGRPWRGAVRREPAAAGLAGVHPGFTWIFLDLFSPRRHPEDWEPELLDALGAAAAPRAVLCSYCTARPLREGLQARGWTVQRPRTRRHRRSLLALRDKEAPNPHNGVLGRTVRAGTHERP